MDDENSSQLQDTSHPIRSLKELVELVSGRGLEISSQGGDVGLAELLPFPFLGLVGQMEMKLALLLSLVNQQIGGVLLIGPRGTGKTTAVRSLQDITPAVTRSTCFYGCLPEDVEHGGIDAVCPDCARRYGEGKPLTFIDRVHLVELPLNSLIEDVVGGLDERALIHEKLRLKKGILAQADLNILFVDEVNLLKDDMVDAILDGASQGSYTVRRGPHSATYRSRFSLIGSMNPEEGWLRPQIMDRFGLRVVLRGLTDPQQRLEVYHRVHLYRSNPHQVIARFARDSEQVCFEIQTARELLPTVEIPDQVARVGIHLIQSLGIPSIRSEITLFESARAYAAMDSRRITTLDDLKAVVPMALRLRRSKFIDEFLSAQDKEESELQNQIDRVFI